MAGNSELIDTLVDPIANKQVEDLKTLLNSLEIEFVDATKKAIDFNNALSKSDFKNFNANAAKAQLAIEKLQQAQNKTLLTQNQVTASNLRLQQQQDRNTAAAQKALSPYQQLSKELDRQRASAKDLAITYGESSPQFLKAAEGVKQLDSQLKGIDQTLGQSQRNVGNYGNIFTKAFSGIRTLANIIPNFGIGTFFLLLGTGIAKLAESIGLFNNAVTLAQSNLKNLNEVSKEANKNAGEQATNLRILYTAATDVNNSMRDRIRAAQELKKEFPGEFKNASDLSIVNGELSSVYRKLTDDILANAKAKAAASKISELAAQQLDIDFQKQKIIVAKSQEIANVKPVKTLGGGNAAGVDVLPTFADPATQRKTVEDQQQTLRDLLRGELRSQDAKKKALQDQIDFLTKFAGGNNAIAKALSGDQTGQEKGTKADPKGVYNEQVKALKLAEDAILQNSEASYDQRLDAVDKYYKAVYDLTKKASDKGVLTQLEASNQFQLIDNETAKDRLDIQKKAQAALVALIEQGVKSQTELEKQQVSDFKDTLDEKLLAIDDYRSSALKGLADQYKDSIVTTAQYNQQVEDIEKQSALDRVKAQIDTQQQIIDKQKEYLAFGIGSQKELQASQDQLTKFQIQASDLETKNELDNIKKIQDARKQMADLEKEVANQSLDLIQALVDGGYQRQLNALDDVSKKIAANGEVEKQQIEDSLLSSTEKARQEKIIDAQTAAQQAQIAKQEADIKNKQAVFDRIVSLAKIAEATAVAEVQALTYLSNPFTAPLYPGIAALIAGLGAAQIATVLATPLPHYEKGTHNAKGGLSVVGERGSELIMQPNGLTYLSKPFANVIDLPKGSTVVPHLETARMIDTKRYVGGQAIDINSLLAEQRKTTAAISGAKRVQVNGWLQETKAAQANQQRRNQYFRN